MSGMQRFERRVVESDPDLAAEHRDRRGDRAVVTDGLLDLARDAQVVGPREAVRDDRALERDDGLAVLERVLDLIRDQHRVAPERRADRGGPGVIVLCAGRGG